MKKEKYIEEKYTTKKGHNPKEVIAFVVNLPLPDGKKYCKRFHVRDFKTANDAKKAAVKDRDEALVLIHQIKEKKDVESSVNAIKKRLCRNKMLVKVTYTVDELYQMVPEYFSRRKNTYKKLDKEYRKYIRPKFGEVDIHDIESADILGTLQACADNCVQQVVSNVKTVWHRIYQVAMLKGLKVTDWTNVIDVPRSEKHTERSNSEQNITEKDFEDFIDYLEKRGRHNEEWDYNRAVVIYMLRVMRITGLRPQEVKALRRSSIRFEKICYTDRETGMLKESNAVLLTVTNSIGSTHAEELAIRDTKTENAKRIIPLDESSGAIDLFKEILLFSKNDVLFLNYKGELISSDWLSDYLYQARKAYKRDTGIDIDVHASLFRKAYSADLYREHENPAAIKALMGHKHEDMSLNWYATSSREDIINTSFHRKYKED